MELLYTNWHYNSILESVTADLKDSFLLGRVGLEGICERIVPSDRVNQDWKCVRSTRTILSIMSLFQANLHRQFGSNLDNVMTLRSNFDLTFFHPEVIRRRLSL
jgi:hypothetical protein